MRRARRLREEGGAYLVLFAIMISVFFMMVATVVDLGWLRMDAREDQSVTDFAATAGAAAIEPLNGGRAVDGCNAAWDYFIANAPEASRSAPSPCPGFASQPVCTYATVPNPRTVTGTSGPYEVRITYPVVDASAMMEGRLVENIDGAACTRIGVEVTKERSMAFGGVMGQNEGSTTMDAVARTGANWGEGTAVSLIILDPTGCNSLLTKGQAVVEVRSSGGLPGVIAVDSAATEMDPSSGQSDRNCSNAATYAIDAYGTQNSSIRTGPGVDPNGTTIDGAIFSFALMPGSNAAQSYEEGDVMSGRVSPRPVAHARITRSPIDWRYNCKVQNDCPEAGQVTASIDALRSAIGTNGPISGFREYPRDIPGGRCNLTPSVPPVVLVGNWWINCSNFSISNPVAIVDGSVVFQGSVSVGATGSLTMNAAGMTDRYVYVRSGDFVKDAQASILLNRTFVHMANGRISFGAGSGSTIWVAPESGAFEDLTLWSESPLAHDLGGQANLQLEGTFFTPNAYPFRYTGQGGQNQVGAQFITYRLEATGQGTLVLTVDPHRSVLVPLEGIRLIR